MNIELGNNQKRLIASALTALAVLTLLVCFLLTFAVLREAVITFKTVIAPLVVAGILAMLLRPVVDIFRKHLRLGRATSIGLLYCLVAVAGLAFAFFVVPILVAQALEFIRFQGSFVQELYLRLRTDYPQLMGMLGDYISVEELNQYSEKIFVAVQNLIRAGIPAIKQAGEVFGLVIAWATGLAIIPIYLFYFLDSNLNYTHAMGKELTFIKPSIREDCLFLANEFVSILVAFFRGQILIGLLMGVLFALGFTLAGLQFAIVIGLFIGLLNIIPYLGTIIGLSIVIPLSFFQEPDGGTTLFALVIGVFVLVQLIEGYLLTPRIMGQSTGLHPMVIIVAIFFWGTALEGLLGMILAIPLTAFFIVAWRLASKKYLPLLTGHSEE